MVNPDPPARLKRWAVLAFASALLAAVALVFTWRSSSPLRIFGVVIFIALIVSALLLGIGNWLSYRRTQQSHDRADQTPLPPVPP